MRRITAGFLFLCLMTLCLAGCGGKAEFDAKTYVKGVLDTAYKGEYSDYTAQTGVKKGDAEAAHKEFLKESAVRLAAYCGLKEDEIDAEKFEGLCEKLYKAADYEVTEAKETDHGYEVTVTLQSAAEAFRSCADDTEELREEYQNGLAKGNDRKKLAEDYGQKLLQKLEEPFYKLPEKVKESGTQEQVTVIVEKDGEKGYSITSESLAEVQERMFGF